MKFIFALLFSFSVSAETIRISLLNEPCTPQCAQEISEMFNTHSAFRKVAVLSKYKEIYLEANDWVRDQDLKQMLRSKGLIVNKIRRTTP